MSENVNEPTKVEGKGMGVAGFIISLVALIFAPIMAGIATASIAVGGSGWLAWFWVVVSILSVVLSAMGMMKLGKTGGKKGLAIAGLVVGIVAVIWSLILAFGVQAIDNGVDQAEGDLQELRDRLENQ
jgi:Na+/melibiose symporter-like transporter